MATLRCDNDVVRTHGRWPVNRSVKVNDFVKPADLLSNGAGHPLPVTPLPAWRRLLLQWLTRVIQWLVGFKR